jgi:hypothetical protein
VVGYSPFSLCVIHNEGLCPSSENINRLTILCLRLYHRFLYLCINLFSLFQVVPFGFRRLLNYITTNYNKVPIIVTENGYADFSGVDDHARVSYYGHYLNALLHAIHEDHSNVQGYFAWSLMDNFEWDDGYV